MEVEIIAIDPARKRLSFIRHYEGCECTPCKHPTKKECDGGHVSSTCQQHNVNGLLDNYDDEDLIVSAVLGYAHEADRVQRESKAKVKVHPLVGKKLVV